MCAAEAKQLHVMQHAMGLDCYGRGAFHRNHFCTGSGPSTDHPICSDLVGKGFMTVRNLGALSGGDDVFSVTEVGKAWVIENSPAVPVPVRTKARAARLDGDAFPESRLAEHDKAYDRAKATGAIHRDRDLHALNEDLRINH